MNELTEFTQATKNMQRAIRRHHRQRLKHARKTYWGRTLTTAKELGRVVDTPKPCSCFMCGNPRRYFQELTIQERKASEQIAPGDVKRRA